MRRVSLMIVMVGVMLSAKTAFAQYKNTAFGLDVGPIFVTKPSPFEAQGNLLSADNRPLRLSHGFRIGGESAFKMDEDHWWFIGRFNASFMRFSNDNSFDIAAGNSLGTLFGIQGMIGVRYVILTDNFRPYIQGGFSYMHLFSFAGASDSTCGAPEFCAVGGSNQTNFLPHTGFLAFHVTPGVEIMMVRDIALHIFLDYQRWMVINADDNNAFILGMGVNFFG